MSEAERDYDFLIHWRDIMRFYKPNGPNTLLKSFYDIKELCADAHGTGWDGGREHERKQLEHDESENVATIATQAAEIERLRKIEAAAVSFFDAPREEHLAVRLNCYEVDAMNRLKAALTPAEGGV